MTRVRPLFVLALLAACGSENHATAASPSTPPPAEEVAEQEAVEGSSAGSATAEDEDVHEDEGGATARRGERETGEGAAEGTPAAPPSVAPWQTILDEYATADGGFRYAALRANDAHRALLDEYVQAIGAARDRGWSRDAALAFYIDAYNALTVKSVLDLWPVESVMQEDGFFDERTHRVAGRTLTLNGLENDVIRSERFAEPRIHFAVNCASAGCPPLQRQAFTAGNLERLLERATRAFVRRTTRIRGGRARLSQIFEWFAGDFEASGGVRAFVARYLPDDQAAALRDQDTRLAYTPYDWALNDRP
ncbi:MAG: hypothetical protein CMN29_24550 [Sandaracinus sp.]|nr:hypothetical protein [Sandaracinus sp.]